MGTEFKQTRRSFLKSSAAVIGGSAGLAACASSTRTSSRASNLYPRHNERTKGWMRFIWDKATTADDWSYSEDIERPWGINIPRGDIDFTIRDDRPHPWWDQYSSAPMLSSSTTCTTSRGVGRQGPLVATPGPLPAAVLPPPLAGRTGGRA